MQSQKGLCFTYNVFLLLSYVYLASSDVSLCDPFKIACVCVLQVKHIMSFIMVTVWSMVEIFHWRVFIHPSSINFLRWGPTKWVSCRWDTLCGHGMAPTWSRCRITGTWPWPRWRNDLLSLWRQWTPWLVHVSATLYRADDSPTGQRRKWCCNTLINAQATAQNPAGTYFTSQMRTDIK